MPLSQETRPLLRPRRRHRRRSLSFSGALAPLRGLVHFLAHPYLYPLLRSRLLPCLLLSIFTLGLLFTFAYLPQVAFLALFQHRGSAWVNGTVLVLGEGAVVVAIMFEAFFADETQVDIFDAVLVSRGLEDLVQQTRPVADNSDGALNPVQRLGRPTVSSVYAPFSFRQIFEFVVFLPLNFVPVIGVPAFLLLTGYRAGPLLHWRYFKLRGMDRNERKEWVRRRRWQYNWFGIVALVLQLVPVLSMLLLLTTAAGSALWAAGLEEERRFDELLQQQADGYREDPVAVLADNIA